MGVYVVYEMMYGELLQDTRDCTYIIGVYTDIEKAKETAKIYIDSDINEGYVLDKETNGMISGKYGCWRMFWNYQENWNCYYEIVIEYKEVK